MKSIRCIPLDKFSDLLRKTRETRGLTVRVAAADAGVSSATFSRAEWCNACEARIYVALCIWIQKKVRT